MGDEADYQRSQYGYDPEEEVLDDWRNEYEKEERMKQPRNKKAAKKVPRKRAAKKIATAPKRKPGRKPREPKAQSVLVSITQAVVGLYPEDYPTPGIVLAYLPDRGKFYGSVNRFVRESPAIPPRSKRISAFRTYGVSPEEVLKDMGQKLYDSAAAALVERAKAEADARKVVGKLGFIRGGKA